MNYDKLLTQEEKQLIKDRSEAARELAKNAWQPPKLEEISVERKREVFDMLYKSNLVDFNGAWKNGYLDEDWTQYLAERTMGLTLSRNQEDVKNVFKSINEAIS